jgi:hypothetical protein
MITCWWAVLLEWLHEAITTFFSGCLNLIVQHDEQPADQLFTTDEVLATLRNTARARRNPETSGMP